MSPKRGAKRTVGELAARHGIDADQQRLLDQVPAPANPDLAETLSADLVVLGVVIRSQWKRLWIDRMTEHILDRLRCDVLAVH